ncbi:MAG: hypothetical protein CMJ32_03820 [Phycisphaerae bacterium]|nr:hypothetical protein [Phycisphaerae bacterium]
MNTTCRHVLIAVGCLVVFGIFQVGCKPSQQTPAHVIDMHQQMKLQDPRPWPYQPVSMTFHPLSRFRIVDGVPSFVQIRIELSDRDGKPTRTDGHLVLEVQAVDDEIRQVSLDLTDPKINSEHWDDITMTYFIPLELALAPGDDEATRLIMEAYLVRQGVDEVLMDQLELVYEPPVSSEPEDS